MKITGRQNHNKLETFRFYPEITEGFFAILGKNEMKHEMKIPDQAYGLELLTNVLLFG